MLRCGVVWANLGFPCTGQGQQLVVSRYCTRLVAPSARFGADSLEPVTAPRALASLLTSLDPEVVFNVAGPHVLMSEGRHHAQRTSVKSMRKIMGSKRRRRKIDSRLTIRLKQSFSTFQRVGLPTLTATFLGYYYFDELTLFIRNKLDRETLQYVQIGGSNQFIQIFCEVIGLLFAILVKGTVSALYQEKEDIIFAYYEEVSEAQSLLEQTTLVCQGRPFYLSVLSKIDEYVKNDLKRTDVPPAELLSAAPVEDPLESIMYMTSVGVPSIVYQTVRSLRQARSRRLGAMQRKFPFLGIVLLYVLALIELFVFPLLSSGTANPDSVLGLQGLVFCCLTGSSQLVLRIIQELWQCSGGIFNVDEVLEQMVSGLEGDLELRFKQAASMNSNVQDARSDATTPPYSEPES